MRKLYASFVYFAVLVGLCGPVTSAQTQNNLAAQVLSAHPDVYLNFNDATTSFMDQVNHVAWTPIPPNTLPAPTNYWTMLASDGAGGGSPFADLNGSGTMSTTETSWTNMAPYITGFAIQNTGAGIAVGSTVNFDPDGSHAFTYSFVWRDGLGGAPSVGIVQPVLSNTASGLGFIFGIQNDGTGQKSFVVQLGDGTGAIRIHYPGFTSVFPTQMFYPVAITYDGSKHASGLKVYVNGAVQTPTVDTDTLAGATTSAHAMTVGGLDIGDSGFDGGFFYALRNWNGLALASSQVTVLASYGFQQAIPPPITIAPQAAGFDPTLTGNKAVLLTNAWVRSPSSSPNYASGSPFSVFIHVNNLPASSQSLAAKDGTWMLTWDGTNLCYQHSTYNLCTSGLPTGFNYDIVVTDGNTNSGFGELNLYVNGTEPESGGSGSPGGGLQPVPGSGGLVYVGGINGGSASTNLIVDEFAIFPGIVDQFFVQSLTAQTKFYLSLLGAKPAVPPSVIISEDGCTDPDNTAAINLAIQAAKLGYLNLLAVVDTDLQWQSAQFFRVMLDSNGLHHIPVFMEPNSHFGSNPVSGSDCSRFSSSVYTVYNASVPGSGGYGDSTPGLRKILAGLPDGAQVTYLTGGSAVDLSDLMQSAADSISSQTGAQLFASKIQQILAQGVGNFISLDSAAGQYVVNHNGSIPIYFFDRGDPTTCCTPSVTGPGFGHSRAPSDPLRMLVAAGWDGEVRTGWDSLPTVNFLSNDFTGTCTLGTVTITPNADPATFGTSSWSATPGANKHYGCGMTSYDDPDAGASSNVFTWFVNSIANTISEGFPRGQ